MLSAAAIQSQLATLVLYGGLPGASRIAESVMVRDEVLQPSDSNKVNPIGALETPIINKDRTGYLSYKHLVDAKTLFSLYQEFSANNPYNQHFYNRLKNAAKRKEENENNSITLVCI